VKSQVTILVVYDLDASVLMLLDTGKIGAHLMFFCIEQYPNHNRTAAMVREYGF
jgi:hypothetical protein